MKTTTKTGENQKSVEKREKKILKPFKSSAFLQILYLCSIESLLKAN